MRCQSCHVGLSSQNHLLYRLQQSTATWGHKSSATKEMSIFHIAWFWETHPSAFGHPREFKVEDTESKDTEGPSVPIP